MIQRVDISWGTLWKVGLFALLAALIFIGRDVLLGLFLAIVVSAGLDFIVNFFERRGIPRTLGVIIVFILFALFLAVLAYFVIPILIADLYAIISKYDARAASYWLGPLLNFRGEASINVLFNRISNEVFTGDGTNLAALSRVLEQLGLIATIVVSAFYLSLSRDGIERFLRAVMPDAYEGVTLRIYNRARKKIGSWFRGQVLLSCIIGAFTWVTLVLLDVPHAALLALITAVLELVPFVGPLLAGLIAVVAAFTVSPIAALSTAVAFFVIHQIEANLLVPLFTKRSVGLHPVIVIGALLVGIESGSLLGIVAAVPIAAVLQEVVEEWSKAKQEVPVPRA